MVNMFSSAISKIHSLFLTDAIVNTAGCGETVGTSILNTLLDIPIMLWEIAVRIIYLIVKFMLLLVDFIFIFIRQFIGINAENSSLSSENADVVFKFVFSEPVKDAVSGIFILAIVIIILFAIFAIIKNEYLAATTGSPNSKKQVLVGTLKSLFMIILVPILFIGSLTLSNAILKTLDNVTSGGTSVSMGNQVFIASSFQANCYRRYAMDNKRIPITYNFEEVNQDGFFDHATDGTVKELEEAFEAFSQKSAWDRGFTTYLMFLNNTFLALDYVEEADNVAFASGDIEARINGSGYHSVYDEGLFTKRNEYFAMADVIDWSIKNNRTFYFKTPQDIRDSWSTYGSPSSEISSMFTASATGDISFSIQYSNESKPTIYTSKQQSGSVQDEKDGSVFLVCTRDEHNRFIPIVDGMNFSTSYSVGRNFVIARGFFDEGGYPTAIREEGNEINCYRDKLNMPYIADLLPKISYEKPEGGTTEVLGWVAGGFKLITGVDLHEFVPYVYFNFDVLRLFSKSYRIVNDSSDGSFKIDYMFSDRNINFHNVFNYKDINVVILIFVSSLLIGMLFKLLFGAIARVFDLALLFVTYPAVCATIPLDNGSRFSTWIIEVVNSVLSIYGVVIGINLVMIIYPIVDTIQIFSEADFQNLVAKSIIPADWTANFVNFIINLMMLLASFALFKSVIKVISSVIRTDYKDEAGIMARGDEVTRTAKSLFEKTKDVITGQALLNMGKNVVDTAVGFVPGSAVFSTAAKHKKFRDGQNHMANSRNDLAAGVKSGDNAKVAALTKKTEQTTAKYGPKKK